MPRGGKRPGSGRPKKEERVTKGFTLSIESVKTLAELCIKLNQIPSKVIDLALACLRKHPEDWPK